MIFFTDHLNLKHLLRIGMRCCYFFFLSGFSFMDTDDSQDSRGREGDNFLFHSTTSTRLRTLRHLFATLHVRWLSRNFNRNACVYQTATRGAVMCITTRICCCIDLIENNIYRNVFLWQFFVGWDMQNKLTKTILEVISGNWFLRNLHMFYFGQCFIFPFKVSSIFVILFLASLMASSGK